MFQTRGAYIYPKTVPIVPVVPPLTYRRSRFQSFQSFNRYATFQPLRASAVQKFTVQEFKE
jgi:hypothetical protein